MKKIIMFIIIFMFFAPAVCVFAGNFTSSLTDDISSNFSGTIQEQLNSLDTSRIDETLNENENSVINGLSVKGLIEKVINGQLDLSPRSILNQAISLFSGEFSTLMPLIRDLLIISVIGSIMSNLSSAFPSSGASEVGFLICYLASAALVVSSFLVAAGVMNNMLEDVTQLAQGTLPALAALMAFSGSAGSAYIISPALVLAITTLSTIIQNLVTPALFFAATLTLVNNLSEKPLLSKLSELIKKAASWVLKVSAATFIIIISMQGVSVPVLNNAAAKTAKAALSAVPVVGSAMSGAIDLVTYWAGALKNGFLVAVIIIVIALCALPVLKLLAIMLMFRFAAAIMEPISDARVVKAVDALATLVSVMLGACVAAMAMFTFIIIIMLAI